MKKNNYILMYGSMQSGVWADAKAKHLPWNVLKGDDKHRFKDSTLSRLNYNSIYKMSKAGTAGIWI